jgi:hypothetical protein
MCTVSCLARLGPARAGDPPVRLRVVFSRDEQHTRLSAIPPEVVVRGERHVLMPRDVTAGGTWIAANDAGVVFALLNLNAGRAHGRGEPADWSGPLRTRGGIIPDLVDACTAAEALERTHAIDPRAFLPFRVLACDRRGSSMEVVSTGTAIHCSLQPLDAPLMRTSSGLGDDLVIGARRALFGTIVGGAGVATAAAQDAFHRHRWAGAGELSVLMNRADARTVSITTVEVWETGVRMLYHELPDVRTARAQRTRGTEGHQGMQRRSPPPLQRRAAGGDPCHHDRPAPGSAFG